MANILNLLKKFFEALKKKLPEESTVIGVHVMLIILVAFVLSGIATAFLIPMFAKNVVNGKDLATPQDVQLAFSGGSINYRDAKKVVMERNVFNKEGTFPDEKEKKTAEGKKEDFDMNAACQGSSLKLSLLGTIVFGESGGSRATIKEEGYSEADNYQVGDMIVGSDEAQVVAIKRNKVVINNKGKKECLILDAGEKLLGIKTDDRDADLKKGSADALPPMQETQVLQSSWVESELGPGFGKIIQSARLVPNIDAGNVNGFKIFAITKGTLFDKVGLGEGDVITQVNSTVLQAESGFALYQAFLDEKEVRLNILRKGKTPHSITVQIK